MAVLSNLRRSTHVLVFNTITLSSQANTNMGEAKLYLPILGAVAFFQIKNNTYTQQLLFYPEAVYNALY